MGHQIRERITPAWAGKSPSCPTHSAARRDHPRVGGEKLKSGSTAAGCPGSPPRGREKILEPSMGVGNFGSPPRWRGKAVKFRCTCGLQRITPAWAGKRWGRCADTGADRDHPRMGGEKITRIAPKNWGSGSPPRGRGKVEDMRKAGLNPRITPAWAGKSSQPLTRENSSRDHPRVGGEKVTFPVDSGLLLGSPPRGRGKVAVPVWCTVSAGITPAWAGKS